MSDLISRSALIKAMEKKYDVAKEKAFYSVGLSEGFIVCEELIKEQPTVEAREVVHGEWMFKYEGTYNSRRAYCSVCGKRSGIGGIRENQMKPYCPNCGAKMKVVE